MLCIFCPFISDLQVLELVFCGRAAVQMFPPETKHLRESKAEEARRTRKKTRKRGSGEEDILSHSRRPDYCHIERQPLFHLCHLKKTRNRSERTDFTLDPRKQKLPFQRIRHFILIHLSSLLFLLITETVLAFQSCKIFTSCKRLVFSLPPCKAAGTLRLRV